MYSFNMREVKNIKTDHFDVAQSKVELSNLAYFLRRFLIFTSTWLSYFPNFGCKIVIGLTVGFTASALSVINNRIKGLITIGEPVFFWKRRRY